MILIHCVVFLYIVLIMLLLFILYVILVANPIRKVILFLFYRDENR